jgi:soluble lytic murein transglycosylase-like protein
MLTHGVVPTEGSSEGVTGVWQELEARENLAASEREATIEESLRQYKEYNLSRDLAEQIYDVATASEVDPEVAYGLVRAESSFRNTSTSPVGAIGLTQLMPKTAEWLQPGVSQKELRDPATNLRIGFKYLRSLIDKYNGDTDLALVAYNRGPGTVDRELKNGRNPDNGYAAFVHGKADHGHSLYTSR